MTKARKVGEIDLDLREVEVEGWQPILSELVIKAMQEGIKLGHEFPRVDVVRVNDGRYQLCYGFDEEGELPGQYGGHHRTRAYQTFCESNDSLLLLPCNLYNRHRWSWNDKGEGSPFIPIKQILTSRHHLDLRRLIRSLKKLPSEVRREFIEDNSIGQLVPEELIY